MNLENVSLNQETLLKEFLQDAHKDKAVALLCRMAIGSAIQKDFTRAEKLRDRLYELDSMALTEILRVNEYIENEKEKVLSPDRKKLWAKIVRELSPNEANSFFMALRDVHLESDTPVLKQGEANSRLFFVEKGMLKLTHDNGEKEQLIHKIGVGEIIGEETFFSVNVCTINATTLGSTHLSYLDQAQMTQLKKNHPFIEGGLKKGCREGLRIYDYLKKRGIDRRAHKRFNLHAKILVQILSPDFKQSPLKTISAELWDISKRGLSFYFTSKNREAVRRLIGRTLGMQLTLPYEGQQKMVSVTGVVQGVQNHPLDEYSVHIELNREFSHHAIQTIQKIAAGQ